MAGVKGRSGRRTRAVEERDGIGRIVTRAVYLTLEYIEDESIPIDKRVDVASKFALRHMPEKTETALTLDFGNKFAEALILIAQANAQRRADIAQADRIIGESIGKLDANSLTTIYSVDCSATPSASTTPSAHSYVDAPSLIDDQDIAEQFDDDVEQ